MKKIKGPAIFLAQFIGDKEPFNSLPSICKWVSDLGYKGIQLPAENLAVFDLDKASSIIILDETFDSPRLGYKKGDKGMSEIYAEL